MDKRFTPAVVAAAQAGQRAYGVPSSVSLAQWAVESDYGTAMPQASNNPFGIKATAGQASVTSMTTEVIGGVARRLPQAFRAFTSLAEAFEAHAKLLATVSLYAPAMKAWLGGDLSGGVKLMAQHYATDPKYAATLLSVIGANGLDAIDREVALEFTPPPAANSTATSAAAKPAPAPAAAAKAPPAAAAKASTVTASTTTKAAAPAAAHVNVLAGAINVVENVVSGLVSSLKATTSSVTSGAVTAATNGTAVVGSISDGEAAIADIKQAVADAKAGKWQNEPGDVIDFLKHVFAILSRFGVNVPVVSAIVEALPALPAVA